MQEFLFKYVEESDSFCAVCYQGDAAEVVIPQTHWGRPVTILFDDLFKGHAEVRSVAIPDTVTEIGGFVFDGCINLRHINLPAALESMWQYAFTRCGLETIVLPDRVTQIIPYTFMDCKRLRQVRCGSGMRKIFAHSFKGCDSLDGIVCDPSVFVDPDFKM